MNSVDALNVHSSIQQIVTVNLAKGNSGSEQVKEELEHGNLVVFEQVEQEVGTFEEIVDLLERSVLLEMQHGRNNFDAIVDDRFVQSGVLTVVFRFGVDFLVDQGDTNLGATCDGSEVQRGFIRSILGVDVGAEFHESLNNFDVASLSSEMQRRVFDVGRCVDVGAEVDESFDDLEMAAASSDDERSGAIRASAAQNRVRAKQRDDDFGVSAIGGEEESLGVDESGGLLLDQLSDDAGNFGVDGAVERRGLTRLACVDVCAKIEEKTDHCDGVLVVVVVVVLEN